MDGRKRIERALDTALARASRPGAPPLLANALRYAVFPGGARVRPRLCLAVAIACGDDDPAAADCAAVAIELLHCASLIHDDLPCFDDAAIRRGKPSVHKAFGEPLAVLAGDALIVLAFQTLGAGACHHPERLGGLLNIVARGVGMPSGIAAGQAWESEPDVRLTEYQQAKTGALFAAAAAAGAAAAGVADSSTWRVLGERLGGACQVADDIRDMVADPEEAGKPVGQDTTHDRPNAVHQLGVGGAMRRFDQLVASAIDSIPPCRGSQDLSGLIAMEAKRFLPSGLLQDAA